jgi:hypothetical protein
VAHLIGLFLLFALSDAHWLQNHLLVLNSVLIADTAMLWCGIGVVRSVIKA